MRTIICTCDYVHHYSNNGDDAFAVVAVIRYLNIVMRRWRSPNRGTADNLESASKQRQWEQERRQREEFQKEEIAKYVKYMKYLETVLNILQATPQWKEAMQSMTQEEMRVGGKIAEMVDKLEPHIIEQLAKAKILELQRLEQEIKDQLNADNGAIHNIKCSILGIVEAVKVLWRCCGFMLKFRKERIYPNIRFSAIFRQLNHCFWIEYQSIWISTTGKHSAKKIYANLSSKLAFYYPLSTIVADMDELEEQRKHDFKQYELKNKAEEDHRMAQMIQTEREQYIRQMKEQRRRHSKHEPLKHPGSRNQLRKVWEDTDKLDKNTYDPTTLFGLHDRNNDGYWSYHELNTIFLPEIEKLSNFSDLERLEELYRMRDHVMKQMDTDGDHRISRAEFLSDREAQEEKQDQGWEDIGDKEQYTKEELEIFEKEYAKQQGWGEYAYSTPAPTSDPSQMNHVDQASMQKLGSFSDQLDGTFSQQLHQIPVQHLKPLQPMQHQRMNKQPVQQRIDKIYGV
ncbi:Nucleobindin-2 [Dirofilaria immitis]|nr:Nucleobindin-2 [Dirofilaria immitis]